MNHEERVLSKIAFIAACFADGVDKGTGIIKAAELAVKWESEAATDALYDNNHDRPRRYVNRYLEERGLIPPQTQTT